MVQLKDNVSDEIRELFQANRICAILRNIPSELSLNYAKAAYEGGIRLFEVAMNTSDGAFQIELLKRGLPDDVSIGAGTVITKERCEDARNAGAKFFLTPSVSVQVFDYCNQYRIPLLPGVLTPSDVNCCLAAGYKTMKLFPANEMPKTYIRSLKGPFEGTDYVAVGGVSLQNYSSFLAAGYIGVGIGSNLIPAEYVKERDWVKAAEYIRSHLN